MADDGYDYDYDCNDTMECICEINTGTEVTVQVYVHSCICVLGLLGNLMVIVTYAFYKRAKSMTDVYLLNVAIADVLFVISLPLIIYNETYNWTMGRWACKILRGMYSINLYSGMMLLACISSDRYIAIVQARRSYRIRSRTLIYSRIICSGIWLFAIAVSIPTIIYNETYDNIDLISNQTMSICYLKFEENETAQRMKILVPSIQVAIGFFLPLLIMGFCYSSIIYTLISAKNFQKHKAVRVVMAVVVVFIACHLPYNVTLLYHTLSLFHERECEVEKTVNKALMITETLAYFHCCLNPVLYAFVGVKFRNHFRKILSDLWCLGKKYIYRRSSRSTEVYISTRKSMDGSNNENGSSFTF
ncbi:C-C chemokine receptor type 6 [Paramormyrops kingsleyae]|uniref:C-C chemokine receptor type 6 n=1 Tax=Paramormyrops kingsleyae TaxID=1676925 RepID=UPI000CD6543C|nr:C-C chemokine receptor type 6-like [Paramormyrops kingsleyae]